MRLDLAGVDPPCSNLTWLRASVPVGDARPILTDALTPEMQRQWARMEELRLSRQCIEKEPWLRDPQELHRHPPGMVCKECVRTMTERT